MTILMSACTELRMTTTALMPRQNVEISLLIHYLGMLLPLLQDIPDGLF
jgi:hypothetical protein